MILARESRERAEQRLMLAVVGQRRRFVVVEGPRPQRRLVTVAQPGDPVAPARRDDAPADDLRHPQRTVVRAELDVARGHHLVEASADRRKDFVGVEEGARGAGNHAREAPADHGALFDEESRDGVAVERCARSGAAFGAFRSFESVGHGVAGAYARRRPEGDN